MKRKGFALLAIVLCAVLLLTSCLPGDGKATAQDPAGFWGGVWHGIIAPISLIVGIFDKNIRIYETSNKGWWYDLGFFLTIASGAGGGTAAARRKRNRREG
ncbi:MAG: hypothetical protein ABFC75_03910 [Rectinema sp.]